MDFTELKNLLKTKAEFQDLDLWAIAEIHSGETSPHTYRFQFEDRDYFVKETKDNEIRILKLLTTFELEVGPRVIYPELLEQNVLVAEYVDGEPMVGKHLDPVLIRNYAAMQNALNSRSVLEQTNAFSGCTFADVDDGFYRRSITRCFDQGYGKLLKLREYRLPIVREFIRIADHLRERQTQVTDEFSNMPFAWLHHDFREAHIMGQPPKVVDWGSSYGHGPFLFDLAPFLFVDKQGLNTFIAHSDVCRDASREAIERWLYAANCASYAGLLLWRLKDPKEPGGFWDSREECKRFLEYEYQAYKGLLNQKWTVNRDP